VRQIYLTREVTVTQIIPDVDIHAYMHVFVVVQFRLGEEQYCRDTVPYIYSYMDVILKDWRTLIIRLQLIYPRVSRNPVYSGTKIT
jgi:hypothetical protein